MRNIWEVLVLIGVLLLLVLLLFPLLSRPYVTTRRKSCDSNLSQIVKACVEYQEPNGDFFPAFMQGAAERNPNIPASGQGSDYTFRPMPSLASLYPPHIRRAS